MHEKCLADSGVSMTTEISLGKGIIVRDYIFKSGQN